MLIVNLEKKRREIKEERNKERRREIILLFFVHFSVFILFYIEKSKLAKILDLLFQFVKMKHYVNMLSFTKHFKASS